RVADDPLHGRGDAAARIGETGAAPAPERRMTRMRIVCLCGSLRADSTNMRLLHAFRDHAPADFRIDIVEGLGDLPIFNPDFEDTSHPRVEALANAIGASDGLLIASPEYAHGIPGGLKNALDWLVSRFEIPDK